MAALTAADRATSLASPAILDAILLSKSLPTADHAASLALLDAILLSKSFGRSAMVIVASTVADRMASLASPALLVAILLDAIHLSKSFGMSAMVIAASTVADRAASLASPALAILLSM